MIELRKVLFILGAALLFIVGCSNGYHESIEESFAKDTEEVINVISTAVDNSNELNDEDQEKVDSYISKYENELSNDDEAHSYLLTNNLINDFNSGMLPSELENKVDDIEVTLQGGFEAYKNKYKEE